MSLIPSQESWREWDYERVKVQMGRISVGTYSLSMEKVNRKVK
jgi:hypothetical protein